MSLPFVRVVSSSITSLQFDSGSQNSTSIHEETEGWPVRPKYKSFHHAAFIRDHFLAGPLF